MNFCCGWDDRYAAAHHVHPSAVIIGLVYILLPFMVMPLYSSIEKLDRPLLEAAKDLAPASCKPLSASSFR
jgi:ABC-type spermidine/putrescine transport system permease subunit I